MDKDGQRSGKLLEHLAIDKYVEHVCRLKVPSDALTWTRFCGSLSLVLVVLLFLSGAFMTLYYSPAPGAAYDSVDYAQFTVLFGDVLRGVHFYSWNLLLVFMGLHLMGTFLVGAYKAPRQLVWVSGVLVLLVVPSFIVTGDLLPWDQKGYWSTQVRNSIISSVPVVGDFILRVLQGGPRTGIVALTRFYVLHILFLPCLLIFLIAVHFHFLAHRGLSEPLAGAEGNRKTVHLFPNMFNRWMVVFVFMALIIGLAARYWPAPLGDPADPTDSAYVPKPEWWVLFLNQLVSIFKGPLMFLATVVIPGCLVGLLILLPFIDRTPQRHPFHRKKVILIVGIIGILLIALSIIGYVEHFMTPHE